MLVQTTVRTNASSPSNQYIEIHKSLPLQDSAVAMTSSIPIETSAGALQAIFCRFLFYIFVQDFLQKFASEPSNIHFSQLKLWQIFVDLNLSVLNIEFYKYLPKMVFSLQDLDLLILLEHRPPQNYQANFCKLLSQLI